MFFGGVFIILLHVIRRRDLESYYYEIIGLIVGYLFAICNYLATNTEILSMSAMFIVPVMASISISVKYVKNNRSSYYQTLNVITVLTFIISLFILRMTYVWGGSANAKYDVRLDEGIARGIYTTAEYAEEYNNNLDIIRLANITADDNFLCIPINALCYLETKGKICSPYVVRFETDIDELQMYYDTHPYKIPTKVLIKKDVDNYEHYLRYLEQNGYVCSIDKDEYCLMKKK